MRLFSLVLKTWIVTGWLFVSALVQGAETITFGAEDDWAPFSSKINGEAQGFAVDVVRESYRTQGLEVKFVPLPFARCMNDVSQGRIAGCFNKVRNSYSEDQFLWPAKPLFTTESIIYAPASSTEKDLNAKSLQGKTVGVTHGYEYGKEFDENASILRDVANQDELGFRKLKAKRYAYMVSFEKVAEAVFVKNKDLSGLFKPVGVAAQAHLYVVFSKKHPGAATYRDKFNAGFNAIEKSGDYKRLELKWL